MPQFFHKEILTINTVFSITGVDYRHIAVVRRKNTGDEILVRDCKDNLYKCKIISIHEGCIHSCPIEQITTEKNCVNLTVALSLLKGGGMDYAIEKCVEVGVTRIIPFISERSIPKITDCEKKIDRWQKIANEACKQSMRNNDVYIDDIVNYSDVISSMKCELSIVADLLTTDNAHSVDFSKYNNIILAIGPEGGFSKNETSLAEKNEWRILKFLDSQLKAETAAPVIASIIIFGCMKGKIN